MTLARLNRVISVFLHWGSDIAAKFFKVLTICSYIAAGMLFIVMLMIVSDITGRYLFNKPLPSVVETAAAAMAFIVFLTFAYTEAMDRHIRVNVLVRHFPKPVRGLVEIFVYLVCITFFSLLFWDTWQHALQSWHVREYMTATVPLPLYPSKFVVPIGTALLVFQFLINLARSVASVLSTTEVGQ